MTAALLFASVVLGLMVLEWLELTKYDGSR